MENYTFQIKFKKVYKFAIIVNKNTNPLSIYYLYRHIRLDKEEPFYVGIGKKINRKKPYATVEKEYKRAFSLDRNNMWDKIVEKTNYEVEIVLESNDLQHIKQKEIEFIKLYGRKNLNTGTLCNLTDGGEGAFGRIVGDITRRKISEKNKGRKWSEESKKNSSLLRRNNSCVTSPETKIKLSKAMKGRKRSEESIRKQILSKTGTKFTEEQKLRLSVAHLGIKPSEEAKKKMSKFQTKLQEAVIKPVLQYDLNENIVREWKSSREILKNQPDIHQANLSKCLRGERKSTGGFIFKYKQ